MGILKNPAGTISPASKTVSPSVQERCHHPAMAGRAASSVLGNFGPLTPPQVHFLGRETQSRVKWPSVTQLDLDCSHCQSGQKKRCSLLPSVLKHFPCQLEG